MTMLLEEMKTNDADENVIVTKRETLTQDFGTHAKGNIKSVHENKSTRPHIMLSKVMRGKSLLKEEFKTQRKKRNWLTTFYVDKQ